MEQAKAQGQAIGSAAQDGTYAAGVHRVTELMPVLMNDIISTAPEDHKVRKLTLGIDVRGEITRYLLQLEVGRLSFCIVPCWLSAS